MKVLSEIDSVTTSDGRLVPLVIVSGSEVSDDYPLLFVGPDDEAEMLAAVESGAMGYVIAGGPVKNLEAALTTVADGAAVVPPMMLGTLLRHTVKRRRAAAELEQRLEVLTDREREVLDHLSVGEHRREIAESLFISPETVRTHIQRAMAKLGVHSQTELMALLAPLDQGPS
jgi:DNA-binding NarL/FixJ family response regulator